MIRRILWIMIPMLLLASLTEAIERRRSQFPETLDTSLLQFPTSYREWVQVWSDWSL